MSTEINATQRQETALQRANAQRQRHGQGTQHSAPQPFADLLAQTASDPSLTPDALPDTQPLETEQRDAKRAGRPPAAAIPGTGPTGSTDGELSTRSETDSLRSDDTTDTPTATDPLLDGAAQALGLAAGLPAAASVVAHLVQAALSQGDNPNRVAQGQADTGTGPTTASLTTLELADTATGLATASTAAPTEDPAGATSPATQHPRGHGAGLRSTQDLQQAHGHTGPGHLVSAAARSDDRTLPPPQILSQQAPQTSVPTPSWHMLTPGQPGSALQADTSASTTNIAIPSTESLLTNNAPSPHTGHGSSSNDTGSGLNTAASNTPTSSATSASSDAAPADTFAQNLDQAMDALGAQVSYWTSNNIRRATVRLDVGLKDPLEVDVRLKDGVAQVDFRTNDAVAREAIKAQAPGVLADLLARSGIGLEGLSVGSNGGQGQTGNSPYQQAGASQWAPVGNRIGSTAGTADTAGTAAVGRPRNQNALDVFA